MPCSTTAAAAGHHRRRQPSAEVAFRHAERQAGPFPSEPARQARRLFRPFGDRGRSGAASCINAACRRRWRSSCSSRSSTTGLKDRALAPRSRPPRNGRAQAPEVWDVLEEVIKDHPCCLTARPRCTAWHPGVRAGADRRQGDPDSSAGLLRFQRGLRRRPNGGRPNRFYVVYSIHRIAMSATSTPASLRRSMRVVSQKGGSSPASRKRCA